MEGYEQIEVGAVTVAVQHDADDNTAMLSLSTLKGDLDVWLTSEKTAQVIAMLQRMQARQAIEGGDIAVGVDSEAV